MKDVQARLDESVHDRDERDRWVQQHPEVGHRLVQLDTQLARLDHDLAPHAEAPSVILGEAQLPEFDEELHRDDGIGLGL